MMPRGGVLHIDDLRDEHSGGADQEPARLQRYGETGRLHDGQNRSRVFRGGRHLRAVVGGAEPAADVDMVELNPEIAEFVSEPDDGRGGALNRLDIDDLRSQV